MQLYYRQYGEFDDARSPIVLLHGMLGSSINWHGIAGRLEQAGFPVIVPDLRNHGRSPHDVVMDYPVMAKDVLDLLDSLKLNQVVLVGHSMGAKAAMWLALAHPDRVDKLVSVDMVPGRSPAGFQGMFDALLSLSVGELKSRKQAERLLAESIGSQAVRLYLLQNLFRDDTGWRWRMNLPVLASTYDLVVDFPQVEPCLQFQGETLFLYGGESDYVTSEAAPAIRELFPFSRLRAIPGAGHWVYSECPDDFFSALHHFLN